MANLDEYILMQIFDFLDVDTLLLRVVRVSRQWNHLVRSMINGKTHHYSTFQEVRFRWLALLLCSPNHELKINEWLYWTTDPDHVETIVPGLLSITPSLIKEAYFTRVLTPAITSKCLFTEFPLEFHLHFNLHWGLEAARAGAGQSVKTKHWAIRAMVRRAINIRKLYETMFDSGSLTPLASKLCDEVHDAYRGDQESTLLTAPGFSRFIWHSGGTPEFKFWSAAHCKGMFVSNGLTKEMFRQLWAVYLQQKPGSFLNWLVFVLLRVLEKATSWDEFYCTYLNPFMDEPPTRHRKRSGFRLSQSSGRNLRGFQGMLGGG